MRATPARLALLVGHNHCPNGTCLLFINIINLETLDVPPDCKANDCLFAIYSMLQGCHDSNKSHE